MSGSFLGKVLFVITLIITATTVVFFAVNKNDIDDNTKEVETITSLNVDTYDYDLYVYKIDSTKLYVSEYFYNKIYLDNNEVKYTEFTINDSSKFFLKNLSNTEKDINNIRITYDPISKEEFKFLLDNYSLLKVHIWLDKNNNCEKALLYSNNSVTLDLSGF